MGTLLAGEIVERVTGRRLRDFLRDELFQPLGMTRTTLGLGQSKVEQTAIYQTGPETEDLRSWGPNTHTGGTSATPGEACTARPATGHSAAGLPRWWHLRIDAAVFSNDGRGHDPRSQYRA